MVNNNLNTLDCNANIQRLIPSSNTLPNVNYMDRQFGKVDWRYIRVSNESRDIRIKVLNLGKTDLHATNGICQL